MPRALIMAPCCPRFIYSIITRRYNDIYARESIKIRAATNDYFDNQLVGRLFFRLIRLNTIILFY